MARLRSALLLLCLAAMPARAADLVVFAASSLGPVMREIARAYQAREPQDRVLLNLAGSDDLVSQISRGVPADVLATADPTLMDRAEEANLLLLRTRQEFAGNRLVIVVPAARLAEPSLQDLARPDVKRIALGNPDLVPSGRYAREALEAAGLWDRLGAKFVLAESDRAALELVARGEVDAGIVYATDIVVGAPRVKLSHEIQLARPIRYEVAVARGTRDPHSARAFVAFMTGPSGRAILSKHGFHTAAR